jgi:hypothetical protein
LSGDRNGPQYRGSNFLLRAQISAFRRAQEICDFKGLDHSGTVKTSCFPVDL